MGKSYYGAMLTLQLILDKYNVVYEVANAQGSNPQPLRYLWRRRSEQRPLCFAYCALCWIIIYMTFATQYLLSLID